jgi:hypothetical protein
MTSTRRVGEQPRSTLAAWSPAICFAALAIAFFIAILAVFASSDFAAS